MVLLPACPPEGVDLLWHLLCAHVHLAEQSQQELGGINPQGIVALGLLDHEPQRQGCLQ